MESSCGELEVSVTGMSDTLRKWIFENQDEFFRYICAVKSNSITQRVGGKYSLFLPRLVEIRKDKTEADDLKKIQDEFANAIKEI